MRRLQEPLIRRLIARPEGRASFRTSYGRPLLPQGEKGRQRSHEETMTVHHCSISPAAKTHARALRVQQTDAERALWRLFRDRRLQSMKWRRQVTIGAYIADFVCFEHHLIVECDGSQHAESHHDVLRDGWLRAQRFMIARFWNREILHERENVLNAILAQCGLPW